MVPKTQACKLVEAICDNIDGSTTFITNLAGSAINLALQGPDAQLADPSIKTKWGNEIFF